MTTELEDRLRDALHQDASHARLVNPDRPADPDARPQPGAQPPGRSQRRLVVVAAAITLVVTASVVVIQHRDRGPEVTTSPEPANVFTDIPPGATVELPPAPFSGRELPGLVWSGREMIVWGGLENHRSVGNGAAFNPATGTWRVIAPAPIGARSYAQVAWTGTEMIVVGGLQRSGFRDRFLRDGAAYNPTTDTWRRLPDAPIEMSDGRIPVWTGDEVVVHGGGAAYSPERDEWRRLADPPAGVARNMVWTGETILMTVQTVDPQATFPETRDDPYTLVRYDPRADEWQTVPDAGSYAALVEVPDAGGDVGAVLALPKETGSPVAVLDRAGNPIGILPGVPVDRASFGDHIETGGVVYQRGGISLGDEALFQISSAEPPLVGPLPAPEAWALNPETGTWRRLDASAPPQLAQLEPVADAGVLIGFGRTSDGAASTGLAYRAP